jgi:hypothetical protein
MGVIDARARFEARHVRNRWPYQAGKLAAESARLGREIALLTASAFVNLFWFGCLCVIVLL